MNHPLVPPNCKYFYDIGGKGEWCFAMPGASCEHSFPMEIGKLSRGLDDDERGVVAAVAFCAWRNEGNRRRKILCEDSEKNGGVRSDLMQAEIDCYDNAEEWAKWGEPQQEATK